MPNEDSALPTADPKLDPQPTASEIVTQVFQATDRPVDPTLVKRSLQEFPDANSGPNAGAGPQSITMFLATVADDVVPWGINIELRDRQLRDFWPTEPILAGALYGVAARNAGFAWTIEGPKKVSKAVTRMLKMANFGKGWTNFMMKGSIDLLTQDNGWHFELIRSAHKPDAPVIGINHLDTNRCRRTGNPEFPIIYTDRLGERHKLSWFDVVSVEDMPSTNERMNNVQYSAVTRVLRAAQLIRDVGIYKREKVSGRNIRAIHLVSGVAKSDIDSATLRSREEADNEGFIRYIQPVIIAGLDPNATVHHELLELASLPDGFNEDITLKWYIAQIANGFGGDYQDFAPLPSGNLGTSQQSRILDEKAKTRGPALFMAHLMEVFNYQGVIPQIVEFVYDDADPEASYVLARLRHQRAMTRALRLSSGEIDVHTARLMAVDEDDLDPDYLPWLQEQEQIEMAQEQAMNEAALAAAGGIANNQAGQPGARQGAGPIEGKPVTSKPGAAKPAGTTAGTNGRLGKPVISGTPTGNPNEPHLSKPRESHAPVPSMSKDVEPIEYPRNRRRWKGSISPW